jgi:hypothetical protein
MDFWAWDADEALQLLPYGDGGYITWLAQVGDHAEVEVVR